MKTKTKAQAFLSKLLVLLFVSVIFMPIFQSNSQERGPLKRYKWYYSQRNYPFDTIPQGAYGDAVAEKNTLTLTNGYQLSSPSVWSPIGPSPFQWTSGLICSGRITNVKYDKRDTTGNTIYVTAAEGGVWKSTNNGSNWTDISGDLPTLSAGGFAIDTTNDILYFGSGDPAVYYGSEKGTGIYSPLLVLSPTTNIAGNTRYLIIRSKNPSKNPISFHLYYETGRLVYDQPRTENHFV